MKLLTTLLFTAFGVFSFMNCAQSNAASFNDISNYDWQDSISFLQNNNIINGYEDGSFKPEKKINRAEFTKIIMESLFEVEDYTDFAENCFTDVNANDWFAPYVCAAKDAGIINGYEDGSFKPAQNINQAEALKIIISLADEEGVPETGGQWFEKYLLTAEDWGMLYFDPDNAGSHYITRGEMAYFIAWLLDEDGTDQIAFEDFGYEIDDENFDWEEMTADDCEADEKYDPVEKICYVEIDSDYFYNEENLSENLPDESFEEKFAAQENSFDDGIPKGDKYEITENNIELISGEEKESHQNIWNYIANLFPINYRGKIREILFFESDDGTAAFVTPIDSEDLSTWMLAINIGDEAFDNDGNVVNWAELNKTLIHEFGHVITLSDSQVDVKVSSDSCSPQFFTGEGCAYKNSFINLFVKKFWQKDAISKIREQEEKTNESGFGSYLWGKNPTAFVSEYASTNPSEDIAETFTNFIYFRKPNSSLLKDKKILFFYELPSLITLRHKIRENLKY